MARRDDPKYEIYRANERAKEQAKRAKVVTMTTYKFFLPIPEVDVDGEGWEYKVAVREVAEEEAIKIRYYLLREWSKVSRQQAIIIIYPYVRYINNRVTYTIEFTTFDSKRYKGWLKEACGRYAEEKKP